jgi:hypothetical protein
MNRERRNAYKLKHRKENGDDKAGYIAGTGTANGG